MVKLATYKPNTPIQSGILNFSTDVGGIILKTGIPTEISEKQLEYLEKNNEEWEVCIRQSLVTIEEKEAERTPELPKESIPSLIPLTPLENIDDEETEEETVTLPEVKTTTRSAKK